MESTGRCMPNILVCGTPGTGKTSTCQLIHDATNLRYINVGDWVKTKELYSGWDNEFDSYVLDEDKVWAHLLYLA
jgi:adenylate kinase